MYILWWPYSDLCNCLLYYPLMLQFDHHYYTFSPNKILTLRKLESCWWYQGVCKSENFEVCPGWKWGLTHFLVIFYFKITSLSSSSSPSSSYLINNVLPLIFSFKSTCYSSTSTAAVSIIKENTRCGKKWRLL